MNYTDQYRRGQWVADNILSFIRMMERNGIDLDPDRVELSAIGQLLSGLPEDFDVDNYLLMLPVLYGVKQKRDYIPSRYITYHFVCRQCGESDVGTFDKFKEPKQCHLLCSTCEEAYFDIMEDNDNYGYDDDLPF